MTPSIDPLWTPMFDGANPNGPSMAPLWPPYGPLWNPYGTPMDPLYLSPVVGPNNPCIPYV